MFTGIITDIGTITSHDQAGGDLRLRIACGFPADSLATGESVACSGCCLTVVASGISDQTYWFEVTLSEETLACTAPNMWQVGGRLNLERALMVGDRLSGHFVTGHVDGVAGIISVDSLSLGERARVRAGESRLLTLSAPPALLRYIAPKGSVTLDGVSLTVNAVEGDRFTVNLIPHTWQHTGFQYKNTGDAVNLEIDLLARYVERLRQTEHIA